MTELQPLTQSEVESLAADWYRKLDEHASVEQYRSLLADDGLELRFPEGTFHGWDGFSQWYERVVGIFFDEVHTLKEVAVLETSDDGAVVKVVVNWEASVWNPPAAKSERIVLDAFQTWIVNRAPQTGNPVIATYTVDELKYAENSARL